MTHWKQLTNPDYLGAYSIEDGQDLILTIDYVREEKVTGPDGKKDDCVVCHFKEKVKPMILNSTNMKMITKLYSTPYVEEWQGRQIQVGIENVKAFGEFVEALRVRNFIPQAAQEQEFYCADCGKKIEAMSKYTAAYLASKTNKSYGRPLCSDCAVKAKEKMEVTENTAKEGDVLNESNENKD